MKKYGGIVGVVVIATLLFVVVYYYNAGKLSFGTSGADGNPPVEGKSSD